MTNIIKVVSVIIFLCGAIHETNFNSASGAKAATCFTGVISPECDEDPIIVRGHVVTVTGTPINNVSVKLLQGSVVKFQTTTNSSGEYCIGSVTEGAYILNLSEPNYRTKNVSLSISSEVVRTDTLIAQ